MYCYETVVSHSIDHKYYNLAECNGVGVIRRCAASIFMIGMENIFYTEDWHDAFL